MSYITRFVAASLVAAVTMSSAVAQEEKVLHVYNWSDIIAPVIYVQYLFFLSNCATHRHRSRQRGGHKSCNV